jgi:hypothetical protein
MLRDGQYSVWFKAPQGEGLGIVTLHDGLVSGGDTMVKYEGTYREVGDEFWVSIKTERYAPGRLPLFQIDKLDIELHGHSGGPIASASGSVKQVPNTPFNVILVPIADQPIERTLSQDR